MSTPPSLAPLLERFFMDRLMQQRQASPHTISSYRDTFRQFLKFAHQRLHTPPSRLTFEAIDDPLIVAFLDGLEKHHGVSVRSRNLRLTAIHSFFRYAAFEVPAHSAQIQRVLAIPSKRFTRTLVQSLTRAEVEARLTIHGVQYLLNKDRMAASKACPSLTHKGVTVHRLRHTMVMDLLQAGFDRAVIALWLGHESVETTQIYLEATPAMKDQALAKATPPNGRAVLLANGQMRPLSNV